MPAMSPPDRPPASDVLVIRIIGSQCHMCSRLYLVSFSKLCKLLTDLEHATSEHKRPSALSKTTKGGGDVLPPLLVVAWAEPVWGLAVCVATGVGVCVATGVGVGVGEGGGELSIELISTDPEAGTGATVTCPKHSQASAPHGHSKFRCTCRQQTALNALTQFSVPLLNQISCQHQFCSFHIPDEKCKCLPD